MYHHQICDTMPANWEFLYFANRGQNSKKIINEIAYMYKMFTILYWYCTISVKGALGSILCYNSLAVNLSSWRPIISALVSLRDGQPF